MTLDQSMFKKAHEQVAALHRDDVAGYLRAAQAMPTLIIQSGLAQAVAFAASREDNKPEQKGWRQVLADLTANELVVTGNLAERVRNCSTAEYMIVTRRTLKALSFLKRAAEARKLVIRARQGVPTP